jgi:hypothetical protein
MNLDHEIRKNRQRLVRLWDERIILEFNHICFTYRVKLKIPILSVRDNLTKKWGLWNPETRELFLSSSLIETQAWFVVIEVLKHEMAHQIVTDIFRVDEAHGVYFARACEMLGVKGWAAQPTADLPESFTDWKNTPTKETDETERLLRRVEKLLALASSSNEHEASAAMQRVQEIYARYNLDRLSFTKGGAAGASMVSLVISYRSKRVARHQMMIASLLNDFFFVRIIHIGQFDAATLSEHKAIEILGTRENVLMAEYVYYFLNRRLDALWKNYRSVNEVYGRLKSSYLVGLLSGFRETLERTTIVNEDNPQGPPTSVTAIVAMKDYQLEGFVSFRYPRLTNFRRSGGGYDSRLYEEGKAEGRRIVIHKGITSEDGNRGKLLNR